MRVNHPKGLFVVAHCSSGGRDFSASTEVLNHAGQTAYPTRPGRPVIDKGSPGPTVLRALPAKGGTPSARVADIIRDSNTRTPLKLGVFGGWGSQLTSRGHQE
jgi:hypothetical protein